jgi:hypothetical protein
MQVFGVAPKEVPLEVVQEFLGGLVYPVEIFYREALRLARKNSEVATKDYFSLNPLGEMDFQSDNLGTPLQTLRIGLKGNIRGTATPDRALPPIRNIVLGFGIRPASLLPGQASRLPGSTRE